MKQLLRVTLLQLKDKLDFSWTKSKKTMIQKVVFGIIKFAVVVAIVFAMLYVLTFIGFIHSKYQDILPIFTIFLGLVVIMNIGSSTYNLMKSLYFADDNRVLITLPITPNKLFISKILVYFIFELKKSLGLLVPGVLGFLIFEYMGYKGVEVTFWTFIWMIVPIFLLVLMQVLISAVLSIPFLYIYRFFKKYPIVDLIGVIVLLALSLWLVITLIQLIPEDIDLNVGWAKFVSDFESLILKIDSFAYPINYYARVFFGETADKGSIHYVLTWVTFVKTLISLGAVLVLATITFFLIKPFYFTMMNKTFEFDKNQNLVQKKNVKHQRYVTYANKEFKLSFRDFDISGSYIAIYIIVPILLLFMDRVFSAISTSLRGDNIAFAVNVLLTILPLLASNSTIATLYSKEGRSAYITKTNPVNPLVPLVSKLLFNLIFCIPSIVGCAIIFANFSHLGAWIAILFALSILLLQYAHIFFCAAQDIMNPQNEAYATTGNDFNNPNENRATITAFVASFIIAIFFYLLLAESHVEYESYLPAFIRLFLISAFLFAGFLYLFIKKIQAFYYEK